MKKILRILAVALLVLVATLGACLFLSSEDRPLGEPSAEAEALADKVLAAVKADQWAKTGAVRWRMADGRPLFLWDRHHQLFEATYDAEEPPIVVRMEEGPERFEVLRGGKPLEGKEAKTWRDQAWADFCNDSFWLNAPSKIRDPGTERVTTSIAPDKTGLLVSYGSGGVTPGDAYLWELDDNGRPLRWSMWVSIIPFGGVTTTWEDWVELPTGALIAKKKVGPLGVEILHEPLEAAASLAELTGGKDPFGTFRAAAAASSQPAVNASVPAAGRPDGGAAGD